MKFVLIKVLLICFTVFSGVEAAYAGDVLGGGGLRITISQSSRVSHKKNQSNFP